ncbi:MAG: hypothetical protein K6U74_02440 [Firmicutes bacterium]|nr:hypothetical protein [Bacillota bacterium]
MSEKALARMQENAALLVLHRLDYDYLACECGESWETGKAALDDLSGSDLLAFVSGGEGQNDYGEPIVFARCPRCNPVKIAAADKIWEAYRSKKEIPDYDSPDDLLEMMGL